MNYKINFNKSIKDKETNILRYYNKDNKKQNNQSSLQHITKRTKKHKHIHKTIPADLNTEQPTLPLSTKLTKTNKQIPIHIPNVGEETNKKNKYVNMD